MAGGCGRLMRNVCCWILILAVGVGCLVKWQAKPHQRVDQSRRVTFTVTDIFVAEAPCDDGSTTCYKPRLWVSYNDADRHTCSIHQKTFPTADEAYDTVRAKYSVGDVIPNGFVWDDGTCHLENKVYTVKTADRDDPLFVVAICLLTLAGVLAFKACVWLA